MRFQEKYQINIRDRFGSLEVVGIAPKRGAHVTYYCLCDCGKLARIAKHLLYMGKTKSCGCLRSRLVTMKNTTHGESNTPVYRSWQSMMTRCYWEPGEKYKNYGGRGIIVCAEWHDFTNFLRDMGRPEKGLTIDRIDVDGNYEPSNCRWANSEQQASNKTNSRYLTLNGVTKTYSQWARHLGMHHAKISDRIKRGWTVEATLTP